MYLNLAIRNVKRQVGSYLIYFMTVSLTVALLFAVNNVIYSRELAALADRGEGAGTALKILVAAISFVNYIITGLLINYVPEIVCLLIAIASTIITLLVIDRVTRSKRPKAA